MAPRFDSPPPTPNSFSRPKPRPPKSPAQVAQIRVRNRRREYLERNPEYLKSAEHEFADPLLYDSLIRSFHTPAEREAEGRAKGYSRTLEISLLRGEARLAKLASEAGGGGDDDDTRPAGPAAGAMAPPATGFALDADIAPAPTTREEGRERWEAFVRDRFVAGRDDEFEYRAVDEDDDLDVLERMDLEEAWFDDETPDWASGAGEGARGGEQVAEVEVEEEEEEVGRGSRPERILHGETGVQDF